MDLGARLLRRLEAMAGAGSEAHHVGAAGPEEPAVLVLGDLGFDHIYISPPLESGREVIIRSYQRSLAGAAGYVSSALARLGAAVHFLTEVGADEAGRELRREAVRLGVRPEGIRLRWGQRSTFSLIFAEEAEESPRQVATYLGTLEGLSARRLRPERHFDGCRLLYSCNYFLMPRLREELGEVFRRARSRGLLTAYDANAGDGWDRPERLETLTGAIYPHTDIVFLNEAESRALSGTNDPERALESISPASETVVIKLGAAGALARYRGRGHRCPGFPLAAPVRDTVGAGDAFQAAFLYFLLRGLAVEECLLLGAANGAATVLQVGGTAGQLDRRGLIAFLEGYDIGRTSAGSLEIRPRG